MHYANMMLPFKMKKLYTFENRWHQRYISLLSLVFFFFTPMFALSKIEEDWVWKVQLLSYAIYGLSQLFIYLFTDYYVIENQDEKQS